MQKQGEDNKKSIERIHQLFYKDVRFTDIEHIVGIMPEEMYRQLDEDSIKFPQLLENTDKSGQILQFALTANCLIITELAFSKYYKFISSELQDHLQIPEYGLKCADILITMNGENELVWNIKKTYLRDLRESSQKNTIMDFEHELKLNAGILMKFKKSMACYQFRLELLQNSFQREIAMKSKDQEWDIIRSVNKRINQERNLMKKILDRFYRNYFCWMYRLKLTKLLFEHILPKMLKIDNQSTYDKLLSLFIEIYKSEVESIHSLIEKNPNDNSALHYLRWITNQSKSVRTTIAKAIQQTTNNKQILLDQWTKVHNEIQWTFNLVEFCKNAYTEQSSYHLLLAYSKGLSK